jgi:hypothetical protein
MAKITGNTLFYEQLFDIIVLSKFKGERYECVK